MMCHQLHFAHLSLRLGYGQSALRAMLIFLILTITGCSYSNPMTDTLTDISQIKDDEVLVVGRLTVLPAVVGASLKQETDTFEPFKRERVLIWIRADNVSANSLGLLTDWGQPFYFAIPKRTQLLTGLERAIDDDGDLVYAMLALPEPLKFLVRVDDNVVYIGNLRLYTDEFDEIVAVEVVDESQSAIHDIRQRFGEQVRFRVSLLAPSQHFH
ncbi:hypothetical protein A1OQ_00720 [Enterovibrio norvegicus FF-162]|uniref:hypothetical protein n=1 Tax=Enterovibrio norvegicus TaxID=188144 RepID=UPI0002F12FC4|nr:hypothetical protein [Enterovibrio norvegicus]OEE77600.1 hypothetical protein A1OQ_00720 [Enterovibrio norvegicus FF-162]